MGSFTYTWTGFYQEFADKLLVYKGKRQELLEIIRKEFASLNLKYPFMDNGVYLDDICPFTVFGCFNKGMTDDNRRAIMHAIGDQLGVHSVLPTDFNGIPVMNNMKAWFFGYKAERKPDVIENLWNLFEAAIAHANQPSEITESNFISCYDTVRNQAGIKWNITMGLYWIRPFTYLSLDERNRNYLLSEGNRRFIELVDVTNLKQLPSARTYLDVVKICIDSFAEGKSGIHSFPELSSAAWEKSTNGNTDTKISSAEFLKWFSPLLVALKALGGSGTPEQVRTQIISDLNLSDSVVAEIRGKTGVNKVGNEISFARNYLAYEGFIDKAVKGIWTLTEKGRTAAMNEQIASDIFTKWVGILRERRIEEENTPPSDRNQNEVRYWIYAPGEGSYKWDEFYTKGIMGISWDEMGDLKDYSTKGAMKSRMKELYGNEFTYMNAAHATWQFSNELQPGDIVYVKKGMHKIIGRGIVDSTYLFDDSRSEFKHIHRMKWTHKGEWEHPGQAVMKTLTDISPYTDYVNKLEALFTIEGVEVIPPVKEVIYEDYTYEDFLSEVFLDDDQYNELVLLLKVKKNVILQGAPGVGKTFAAKRLAYSIMGKRDTSRIMMVQFHQSYSYEDFIMGYRPTKDGFEIAEGPFYQFCKLAQIDNEQDYFFIIDEINRGNLSKIFGELLMLIEKDKRGEKLRLLYSNELFSVPKNVHIIGMMNMADRSLAMIDYALRRRFAFFELAPAFDSIGFKAMMADAVNPKYNALVEQVKALNNVIGKDEALGDGFRIGHSYLCTNDDVTDEWLTGVVKYELVPLLNEYWFDDHTKVDFWTKKLRGAIND